MSESPTSSSSKSVTPTARPSSSSKKSVAKRTPAPSKEQVFSCRIDKRSSYTPLTNRQHNAVPSATAATTAKTTVVKASKKTSGNKSAGSDSTNAVKNVAKPNKTPKNVAATGPKARSNDSSAGVKDLKVDVGMTRRLSRPPPATIGSHGEVQLESLNDTVSTKGKGGAGTGAMPTTCKGAGSAKAIATGSRRAGGEKEQRPKLGSRAKK